MWPREQHANDKDCRTEHEGDEVLDAIPLGAVSFGLEAAAYRGRVWRVDIHKSSIRWRASSFATTDSAHATTGAPLGVEQNSRKRASASASVSGLDDEHLKHVFTRRSPHQR